MRDFTRNGIAFALTALVDVIAFALLFGMLLAFDLPRDWALGLALTWVLGGLRPGQ